MKIVETEAPNHIPPSNPIVNHADNKKASEYTEQMQRGKNKHQFPQMQDIEYANQQC